MKKIKSLSAITVLFVFAFCTQNCQNKSGSSLKLDDTKKDATEATINHNDAVMSELDFNDKTDYDLSHQGFIVALETPIIKDAEGKIVYDLTQYNFLNEHEGHPHTSNPSLWRQSQLLTIHGLFKVTDKIYQVRNYDLANITFIESNTGWIVIDPLTAVETAKASLDLINKHLGERPVIAVIYTHSHADHFGGVRGVVDEKDVKAGKVKIIAPVGFMEEAISENVMAGNVMSRRASYMYGNLLPKDEKGNLGGGLGVTTGAGQFSLLAPTDIIYETDETMTVDGIEIEFHNTPGAEAPAEMMFYFPQMKTICQAEMVNCTMHNLCTPRGAQVRDALAWAKHINDAIELFGNKAEVSFGTHHWPRWGNDKIVEYMTKHRDLYKYIHDQTLRNANQGYMSSEIVEMLSLPGSLNSEFYNRGYYGTLNLSVKAIYQKYLGWYDGNPANLHKLPPADESKRYVDFMGGADNVLNQAKKAYDNGEYRWVATVVNHVVFADPTNKPARLLQADALEQLGYQSESGSLRNFYLSGALELRNGVNPVATPNTASADVAKAMSIELFLDYLAIRINPDKATGKKMSFNLEFTDLKETYFLTLENSVFFYTKDKIGKKSTADLQLTRTTLDEIIIGGQAKFRELVDNGTVKVVNGEIDRFYELISMLDTFEFWFNIIEP